MKKWGFWGCAGLALLFFNENLCQNSKLLEPDISARICYLDSASIKGKNAIGFFLFNNGNRRYYMDRGFILGQLFPRPSVKVIFRFFNENSQEVLMEDIGAEFGPFQLEEGDIFYQFDLKGFVTDLRKGIWRFDGPPGKYTVFAEVYFASKNYFDKHPSEKEAVIKQHEIGAKELLSIFPEGKLVTNKIQILWGGREKGIVGRLD